jgi:hypothetical protein
MTTETPIYKCDDCEKLLVPSVARRCLAPNCTKWFCLDRKCTPVRCAGCCHDFCTRHTFRCGECRNELCGKCDTNNHSEDRDDICFYCYRSEGEKYLAEHPRDEDGDEACKALRFYYKALKIYTDDDLTTKECREQIYKLAHKQWSAKMPADLRGIRRDIKEESTSSKRARTE